MKGGKKAAASRKKMHAAIIMDRSGSMGCMWDEAKNHFKEQVAALRKESDGVDVTVSLTFFDNEVDILGPRLNLKKAEELDLDKYAPRATTALYDAIGTTIGRLKKFKDLDETSLLVVTITDGIENASSDFTQENIQKEIKGLTKKGNWTFTFMAANIDGQATARGLGINTHNTMQFTASSLGMSHANHVAASATSNMLRSVKAGEAQCSMMYVGNEDVTLENE